MVKLLHLKSKKTSEWKGNINNITCLAISPDNTVIFSGRDDGTIKISDLKASKEFCTLHEHLDSVTCLGISSDGRTMASSSLDGTINVWRID